MPVCWECGHICVLRPMCTDMCAPLQWSLLQARLTTSAQFVWVSPDWETPTVPAKLGSWSPRTPCSGSHGLPSALSRGVWRPLLAPGALQPVRPPKVPSLSSPLAGSAAAISPSCLPVVRPLSGYTRDLLQTKATTPHCPSRVK